jgi:hypothetical protein
LGTGRYRIGCPAIQQWVDFQKNKISGHYLSSLARNSKQGTSFNNQKLLDKTVQKNSIGVKRDLRPMNRFFHFFSRIPQEKAVKKGKKRKSHVGFKVRVAQIGKCIKNQKQNKHKIMTMPQFKNRIKQGKHNPGKSENTKFNQVV